MYYVLSKLEKAPCAERAECSNVFIIEDFFVQKAETYIIIFDCGNLHSPSQLSLCYSIIGRNNILTPPAPPPHPVKLLEGFYNR